MRESILEIKKKKMKKEEKERKLCSLVIGKGKFSRPAGRFTRSRLQSGGASSRVISCISYISVCVCVVHTHREREDTLGRSFVSSYAVGKT